MAEGGKMKVHGRRRKRSDRPAAAVSATGAALLGSEDRWGRPGLV